MDVIAQGTFLECLEPYIINDKLRTMPPVVMKDFVLHYEEKNMLESVEACIVHMDVASLDIHHVGICFCSVCPFVSVCKRLICFLHPQKRNVAGGVLESACLSICPCVSLCIHLCTEY